METGYSSDILLEYYRQIQENEPSDLPAETIEKKANGSASVAIGFRQLWQAVHMRRQLNVLTLPERRQLEYGIREEMNLLDRSNPHELKEWNNLLHIHHWSVTADQAEMLAAAFVQ